MRNDDSISCVDESSKQQFDTVYGALRPTECGSVSHCGCDCVLGGYPGDCLNCYYQNIFIIVYEFLWFSICGAIHFTNKWIFRSRLRTAYRCFECRNTDYSSSRVNLNHLDGRLQAFGKFMVRTLCRRSVEHIFDSTILEWCRWNGTEWHSNKGLSFKTVITGVPSSQHNPTGELRPPPPPIHKLNHSPRLHRPFYMNHQN